MKDNKKAHHSIPKDGTMGSSSKIVRLSPLYNPCFLIIVKDWEAIDFGYHTRPGRTPTPLWSKVILSISR